MLARFCQCLVLVSFVGTVGASAQAPPCGKATQTAAYQDSPDELKRLLSDIVTALKHKDEARARDLAETLRIADPALCFATVFGQEEGARLAERHRKFQGLSNDPISGVLRGAAKEKKADIVVQEVNQSQAKLSKLETAVLGAMQSPVTLYDADLATTGSGSVALGYFIYAGGGFRSVGSAVLQALSTAPPLRILVGGNVQRARLIRKVQPTYPEAARAARIQGTVKLKVVVGTDGTIQELEVAGGPPELIEAATSAVRQWKYQLTLLNGVAVEVVTTIDVEFTLSR